MQQKLIMSGELCNVARPLCTVLITSAPTLSCGGLSVLCVAVNIRTYV